MSARIEDRWLTVQEATAITGWSRSTLWRLEQEGLLPARFYPAGRESLGVRWWHSEFMEAMRALAPGSADQEALQGALQEG